MTALALIILLLALVAALSWLAGLVARGQVSACNQRCRQGRDCGCGAPTAHAAD